MTHEATIVVDANDLSSIDAALARIVGLHPTILTDFMRSKERSAQEREALGQMRHGPWERWITNPPSTRSSGDPQVQVPPSGISMPTDSGESRGAEPVDERPALIRKGLLPDPDGVCMGVQWRPDDSDLHMLIPLYEANMRDLASTAARHLSEALDASRQRDEAWALSLKRAEALEYLRVHADLTEAQREMVEHLTTGPA